MTTTTTTTFPFRISRALERTIEQGGVLLAVVERADDRVVVERHFGHLEIRIDHHLQNRIFTQKPKNQNQNQLFSCRPGDLEILAPTFDYYHHHASSWALLLKCFSGTVEKPLTRAPGRLLVTCVNVCRVDFTYNEEEEEERKLDPLLLLFLLSASK